MYILQFPYFKAPLLKFFIDTKVGCGWEEASSQLLMIKSRWTVLKRFMRMFIGISGFLVNYLKVEVLNSLLNSESTRISFSETNRVSISSPPCTKFHVQTQEFTERRIQG